MDDDYYDRACKVALAIGIAIGFELGAGLVILAILLLVVTG